MSAPHTPNDVALQLSRLARTLDETITALDQADREAVEKRAAFSLAHSRAFLSATGPMDIRKHTAIVETHQHNLDAEVADQIVRGLRRRVDATKVRIDVGRSLGAAIRSEMSLAGVSGP